MPQASQSSYDRRAELDVRPAIPSAQSACGMEIFMETNQNIRTATSSDLDCVAAVEAECFPARYRRRDCPCLFSPFLFSSTAEARPQPPYLPRFTSARSCSGRCPQQPRESASRKNARSTHRRRKHRADDRGKPYHSCGEDALWQERDRVNRRSGGISDETDENGESDRRSMTEVRRSPPTENPPPRIPGSGTAKAADF